MSDPTAKSALFDAFAQVGKALSSGRRVEILDVLANGERNVEGLAGELGLSIANASRHLQILRHAGLVTARRERTLIHYRLAAPEVFAFLSSFRSLAMSRLDEVERLAEAYLGHRDDLEPVTRAELARRLR
ncbi:MAG: metalloregulator ArsR/SmtB family transcription factor, partial [Actinomycetota bacterium]